MYSFNCFSDSHDIADCFSRHYVELNSVPYDERRIDHMYDAICSAISECDENHSHLISETNVVDALKNIALSSLLGKLFDHC